MYNFLVSCVYYIVTLPELELYAGFSKVIKI